MGFDFQIVIKHPGVAIIALGAFLLAFNDLLTSTTTQLYSSSVNEAGWILIVCGVIVVFFQLMF